jgi:hypothetical protein
MDNMGKRGESLVNSFVHSLENQDQFLHAVSEGRIVDAVGMRAGQLADVAKGAVVGFGESVAKLGNAVGDIAYHGTHRDEPGADQRLGSAIVDAVLEAANVVTALDGAAGLAKGGAATVGILKSEAAVATEAATEAKTGLGASGKGAHADTSGAGAGISGERSGAAAQAASGAPLPEGDIATPGVHPYREPSPRPDYPDNPEPSAPEPKSTPPPPTPDPFGPAEKPSYAPDLPPGWTPNSPYR